jgi:hypothetical protein
MDADTLEEIEINKIDDEVQRISMNRLLDERKELVRKFLTNPHIMGIVIHNP